MPEGDTLFRVARQITTQICGKRIEAARARPEPMDFAKSATVRG